ncbi:MAG: adenylosuccinate lyase [Candidatus Beckwithbacteria bacterium]
MICPLDGRYKDKLKELEEYFSEEALNKTRVKVELVYLIKLVGFLKTVRLTSEEKKRLISWGKQLASKDFIRVKEIEVKIKHDVKAVEYFIRENLEKLKLTKLSTWVHWGLTSEDVNNLSYGLILTRFKNEQWLKLEKQLQGKILELAEKYKGTAMPARTHGQLAVPTTMGKELAVFGFRADFWLEQLKELKLGGKLNGAVGNFNAQVKLYPGKDWLKFSCDLVEGLGLNWSMATTQVEPGDRLALMLDLARGANNVWLDLARDCWLYIALDYFKQKAIKKEVGSSTMPHKVNPIDFENAEGNLQLSNSLFNMMSNKLTVSRLQRDLSDSTVKRNLGVAFGYGWLARKSLLAGLDKIEPNKEVLKQELENHPEMLSELEQLKRRAQGDVRGYEKVKESIRSLKPVKGFQVEDYIGLAVKITESTIRRLK